MGAHRYMLENPSEEDSAVADEEDAREVKASEA